MSKSSKARLTDSPILSPSCLSPPWPRVPAPDDHSPPRKLTVSWTSPSSSPAPVGAPTGAADAAADAAAAMAVGSYQSVTPPRPAAGAALRRCCFASLPSNDPTRPSAPQARPAKPLLRAPLLDRNGGGETPVRWLCWEETNVERNVSDKMRSIERVAVIQLCILDQREDRAADVSSAPLVSCGPASPSQPRMCSAVGLLVRMSNRSIRPSIQESRQSKQE